MTYTFKLARRLAVSRTICILPALLVLAACSDTETTAPEGSPQGTPTAGLDWRSRDLTPVAVHINPSTVTLETNQLIQFRAEGRNSDGDTVTAAVTWSTTGGTILPDGRFSAAAIGTYEVVARNRTREAVQTDTSTVQVVRRQAKLKSIEVSPTTATLTPGVGQTFTATGRLANGTAVPIGVSWSATGGTIDAGGGYLAGDTAGNYRVIATNTAGTVADTATVSISAPPSPPPPEPPPPDTTEAPAPPPPDTTEAPAPPPLTIVKVTLLPSSVTLAVGATKQFTMTATWSDSSTSSVTPAWSATGGTITTSGLYTAGSAAGTFRVIGSSGGRADTSSVSITVPLGSGTPVGVPFGPWAAWDGTTTLKANTEVFTSTIGSVTASNILARIDAARSKRVKLILAMTGGAHDNYMSTIDGVYQFDMAKWKAKMNTFNTSEIKTALAGAIADGTIIGNSVMDEPQVHGGGDGNTWGPIGTMSKARVDSLCGYVKAIFPALPTGVVHQHTLFEPTKSYRVCDFMVSQYATRLGSVTDWRDGGLAMAQRDGMAIAFSINILNGGVQDRDGTWDCTGTGGKGTYSPNCRMTAQQVTDYGLVLGPAGCALTIWQYDYVFMAQSDNQQAFRDIAGRLATAPATACRR